MKRSLLTGMACAAGLAVTITAARAQEPDRRARLSMAAQALQDVRIAGVTLTDAVVPNAPFSADAVTTVTQTLGDGTKIEQRATAKWYRDSTGRIRREQTVIGIDRLSPQRQPQTTITFDTVPNDPMPYSLNPATRTARRSPRGVQWFNDALLNNGLYFRTIEPAVNNWTVGGIGRGQAAAVPSDVRPIEEPLGTRQIEGVKATGRRSTTTIPAGRIGNDRAIQIVEEQWESPELNMVISSRFSDPRTGVVEYRLTNINRSEPRADLFAVPSDYTVVEPSGGARGGRGGGGGEPAQPTQGGRVGGRGGRGN
ncbi:MAG: hypothetical protein ACRD3G_05650 [Vicinamibacterales bacterium]